MRDEERDWIKRIKQGEKEYLSRIAETYYDDVYRFCCYLTGDGEASYAVSNLKNAGDRVTLRIVSKTQPSPGLEDVYLYYFEESKCHETVSV